MKSAVGLVLAATVLGAMGLRPTRSGDASGKDTSPNVQQGSSNATRRLDAGPDQNDMLAALLNRSGKTCSASLTLGLPDSEEHAFNSFGEYPVTNWGTKDENGRYYIVVWAQPAPAADGSWSVRLINTGELSAVVDVAGQLAIIDGGFGFKVFQIPKADADSAVKVRTTFYTRSWSGGKLGYPPSDAK